MIAVMWLFLIGTIALVALILCLSELWWRKRQPNSEFSRKFVHLSVGTFVAFWPFFLSWHEIQLLSLAFVIGVLLSKWLNIFQAIHSVARPTWGEIYFALVVGLLTFVTHSKGVYAAALLQMSIADGLAAVLGVRYGMKHRYHVFGHTKTILGTATFFVVSLVLLLGYGAWSNNLASLVAVVLSLVATGVENIAVGGLDNLLIPLLIAVAITKF